MQRLLMCSVLVLGWLAFAGPARAQCCQPVVTYYAPQTTYYAPAATPYTTYYAPVTTYYAPQPVYYAPAVRPGLFGWRWRRAWRQSVWGPTVQPLVY
ncbi:MAG: hypothetical protein DWQ42_09175 [Planctomycetota bacterium]|nr:MAG: hypothetical protein DWQ42_09175 [Planctomycetota bacterium]REK37932.1 MAG: hypothetical protein DWQ46_21355 [Planctomycetota bacterium]